MLRLERSRSFTIPDFILIRSIAVAAVLQDVSAYAEVNLAVFKLSAFTRCSDPGPGEKYRKRYSRLEIS